MKNKLFFFFLFVASVLGQTFGQVPDSVRAWMQPPVFQQDTIPSDSLALLPMADTIPPAAALDTLRADSASTAIADSLAPKKHGFLYRTFKSDYPNPNKALYLSLVFPGGGQLYNKRWWKAPIVWGGYAALIYSARYNTKWYRIFREEYLVAVNGGERKYPQFNAGDVKRLRDQFDKRKQLSYIGMLGLHIVQAAEAFVDCHLKTFDVSDDLSLRLKPSFEPTLASASPVLGLGLALSFGK
jgi:hypothetical protein